MKTPHTPGARSGTAFEAPDVGKKKIDIWMPLYIGDYLADTSRLTTEQHGAYLLLIMDYWRNGPPPDDAGILSNIVRAKPAAWKRLRPVLIRFFKVEHGQWRHKRIDEELLNALERKEKARQKAKAAALQRWEKHREHSNGTDAPGIARSIN